jgi:hypothetical protein
MFTTVLGDKINDFFTIGVNFSTFLFLFPKLLEKEVLCDKLIDLNVRDVFGRALFGA